MSMAASASASCGCFCSLATNPKAISFGQHENKIGASLLNFHSSKSNINNSRTLKIVCARRVSPRQREKEMNKGNRYSSTELKSATSIPIEEEEDDDEYDEIMATLKLPGDEPDFWEGPQWDTVGFIIQYLWAFGIVFALVACGVAVRTYNFGASDFKETPVYKEAIESQGLFDEAPETPDSQVFENNPAEDAPSP